MKYDEIKSDGKGLRKVLDNIRGNIKNNRVKCIFPELKGMKMDLPHYLHHRNSELFFQIYGISEFNFPEEQIQLSPGEFLVVPPGLPHSEKAKWIDDRFVTFVVSPHTSSTMVHLSAQVHQVNVPEISYSEFIGEEINMVYDLSLDIVNAYQFPDDIRQQVVIGLLGAVCTIISHQLSVQGQSTEPRRVMEIKHLIYARYHDSSLSVKLIAELIGYSSDYLSYLFHKETGTTLNSFITKVRIDKAKELLRETTYTISEVAWSCGFNSLSYFSKLFSAKVGVSPKLYRK